ncbi:MAG: hypothetical protein V3T72_22920 [Thermoanaerobaculia bacterium]
MLGRIRWTTGALGLTACLIAVPQLAAEEAPERVAVGQEAPDMTLPGLGDESHTLSSLRGEKHAVLVFYRGGW